MADYQNSKIDPKRFHHSQLKFYAVLVPIAIVMILPVLFVLFTAFKPTEELYVFPPKIFPVNPTLQNFSDLLSLMELTSVPVSRYIFNTVVMTLFVILLSILFGVCAGYVLSKSKLKMKKTLFDINTLALMFVPIAVTIPKYIVLVKFGMYNNFLANILPLVAVPVGLFLLKQFIDQIPDALIESARIDGASEFLIVRKIIFPLLKAPIATVAMLSFQTAWGSTEASALYLDSESLKTFAYFMSSFTTGNMGVAGTGVNAAAVLIMFIPNLVMFIVLQSNVMATMAHSGIK